MKFLVKLKYGVSLNIFKRSSRLSQKLVHPRENLFNPVLVKNALRRTGEGLLKSKTKLLAVLAIIIFAFSGYVFNKYVFSAINGSGKDSSSEITKKVKFRKELYDQIMETEKKRSDNLGRVLKSEYRL